MRLVRLSTLGLAALIGGTMLARAEPPKIEERWALMKGMGQYVYNRPFRAAAAEPANLPKVAAAAQEIAAKAPTIAPLFKEGGPGGDALPVAFERPAEFEAAATKMGQLATALAAAAKTGDVQASQAAFQALTQQGCNACHQTFRKPQS